MNKPIYQKIKELIPIEYILIGVFALIPVIIMWADRLIDILSNNDETSSSFFTNLSVEIFGSIVGGIITVFIFIYEIRKNEREKIISNNNRSKDQIRYAKYLILNGIEWVKTQSKFLTRYCKNIEQDPLIIPKAIFDPDQSFSRLNLLFNDLSFFHNYIESFIYSTSNIENYKKMEDCIDYFSKVQDQIFNMRSEAINNYYNRVYRLQEKIRETTDILARMMANFENTPLDLYAKFIFIQLNRLNKIEAQNMALAVSHLVVIKKIILSNFILISGSKLVVEKIDEINNLKKEIEVNILNHKNDYSLVINYFDLMLSKLNKNAINILKFEQ